MIVWNEGILILGFIGVAKFRIELAGHVKMGCRAFRAKRVSTINALEMDCFRLLSIIPYPPTDSKTCEFRIRIVRNFLLKYVALIEWNNHRSVSLAILVLLILFLALIVEDCESDYPNGDFTLR